MPKYLDIDGLRTLWAQITNKISQESNATAEALEGKADLVEGKIPASQLPSYVDDVLEYTNKASFPATGESGKIYLDLATNLTYRWSGTAYTEISPSLALGTTSSTAYRGDYGAAAYKHAVTNKGIAKSSGLYKITTNAEGHVTAATAVVKADITGLGIPAQDTTYENATTTIDGLMSSSDKTKLNSINLSALVKSVNGITPDSNGNVAIEVGGGTVSGDYLPLTGGTLTGNLTISNSNNYSYLYLANQNGENIGGLYTSDSENRLYLINHAPNSTTGKYEGYGLPAVTTDNLTEHKWYKLLTSKETVTIEQGGTGATTPEAARTALGITDTKVTQTLTEDAAKNTNWYLLASSSQSTGTRGAVFTKDLRIQSYSGTTSLPGEVEMIIGNSIASGTAGNKEGFITLYSQGSSYHMIKTTSVSSGITHTLPAVSGTILNSGNYQNYAKLSNLGDVVVATSTPSSVTNGKWYLIKQG